MKRRHFIQLAMTGLVGCSRSQKTSDTFLKAGPFMVTVPENWSKTSIVEKIPIRPVYNREGWARYQKDEQSALKPSYECRPQHWALRFPAALPEGIAFDRENAGHDPTAPQILIHKADEWGLVINDGQIENVKVADVLSNLRKNMDEAMVDGNQIDSPAFVDGSLAFECLRRRVGFTGGYGIRVVTQWTIEPTLMELGRLHYLFLGMSDDNSCQIIATFPLNLPGLPKQGDKKHLGYDIESYDQFSKNYENYCEDAERWLETSEHEITPSIQTLDQVMQSIVASNWE